MKRKPNDTKFDTIYGIKGQKYSKKFLVVFSTTSFTNVFNQTSVA